MAYEQTIDSVMLHGHLADVRCSADASVELFNTCNVSKCVALAMPPCKSITPAMLLLTTVTLAQVLACTYAPDGSCIVTAGARTQPP